MTEQTFVEALPEQEKAVLVQKATSNKPAKKRLDVRVRVCAGPLDDIEISKPIAYYF